MIFEHIVNISGGKDSTGVYLLQLEKGREFRAVFADVMNEAPQTYEFVAKLSERTGGPMVETIRASIPDDAWRARRENIRKKWPEKGVSEETIEQAVSLMYPTGNVFLDNVLLRGGFPSHNMRYCSDRLKVRPLEEQVLRPICDRGIVPVSILGIRWEESRRRMFAARFSRGSIDSAPMLTYRPILDWTLSDVMAIHARHGIKPNPLYAMGFDRVGCMPCIYSSKKDIRAMARWFPEAVERISRWEKIAEQSQKLTPGKSAPTFFSPTNIPGTLPPYDTQRDGIHSAVRWARTARGGRQHLLPIPEDDSNSQKAWNVSCAGHGMCE